MKFISQITKFILILTLISASMCILRKNEKSLTSVSTTTTTDSQLATEINDDAVKKFAKAISARIQGKIKKNKEEIKANTEELARVMDLKLQFPAEVQVSDKLVTKAKTQTDAAVNLFRFPNKLTQGLIKKVATNLEGMFNDDKAWEADKTKEGNSLSQKVNRSINGGIWDSFMPAETKRIYKSNKDLTTPEGEACTRQAIRDMALVQKQHIHSASLQDTKKPRVLGIDNAGIMAMMGDMGTAFFDCEEGKPEYCGTTNVVSTYLKDPTLVVFAHEAKGYRGGSAIAPRKKKERGMVFDSKEGKLSAPHAILLDKITPLGVKETPKRLRLITRSGLLTKDVKPHWNFKASWPWQTLPKTYFNCEEPWGGHYSGSIVEVLFTFDLFHDKSHMKSFNLDDKFNFANFITQDAKTKKYVLDKTKIDSLKLNSKERRCKAALAGAFLISIGYHSAIEVKPTIMAYLGQGMIIPKDNEKGPKMSDAIPQIFTLKNNDPKKNCDIEATKWMSDLMTECTDTEAAKEFNKKPVEPTKVGDPVLTATTREVTKKVETEVVADTKKAKTAEKTDKTSKKTWRR